MERFLRPLWSDLHMLRLLGPGLSRAEPRARMWAAAEQDAGGDGVGVGCDAARAGVRAGHAGGVPDGGAIAE